MYPILMINNIVIIQIRVNYKDFSHNRIFTLKDISFTCEHNDEI